MRKIIYILSLFMMVASCKQAHDTLVIDGVKFEVEGGMDKGIAKAYFDNGTLRAKVEVADGKLNGKYVDYFKSSKVRKECTFKDGLLNGPSKILFETGKVYEEALYDMGYNKGTTTRYNMDGSKIAELKYEKGKMVSLTEYNRGKGTTYELHVEAKYNPYNSKYTYLFSITPKPQKVDYFVVTKGEEYLIDGNIYTVNSTKEDKREFVAKGFSEYGIPFMLTVTK